jgi:ribose transport system permease protein
MTSVVSGGTSSGSAQPQANPRRRALYVGAGLASRYGTLTVLAALIVLFSLTAPDTFPTLSNTIAILNNATITAIIAGGLTIALVCGEYDLSVGYVGSFSGVVITSLIVKEHMPMAAAIVVTLAICGGIGFVNGLVVTRLGVSSFIATLGTGTVVIGFNYFVSSGVPISFGIPKDFLSLNLTKIGGVPLPVFIAAAILIILWVLLNRTVFGFSVQAIGQNAQAARLAGLRVVRARVLSLVASAVCAGAGGIMLASQLGSGQPTAADGYLLTAFAAAFLGSVALRDSEFHIVGTVVGVLTLGVALNGLAVLGVAAFWSYIVQGTLLVIAVALSTVARQVLQGR